MQMPDDAMNAQMHQQQPQQFTEDEIANLREIFDLFDREHQGKINVKDLETIMQSLNRDPNEIREFMGQELE